MQFKNLIVIFKPNQVRDMENIFKNFSIFLPSIEIKKEINLEGKHIPPFEKDFPFIMKLQRFRNDYILTPNYHDYLEIGYIADGRGFLNVENRKYSVKKDDLVVLGNFEVHTYTTSKNQFFDLIVIFFLPELMFSPGGLGLDFEYLKPFYNRSSNFSNIIRSDKIDPSIILNLLEKIYNASAKKNLNFKLEVKLYLSEILLNLVNYYEKTGIKKSIHHSKKVKDLNRLKELISFIQKEYQNNITLEEAAKMVGMSIHYFCKFFKRVIGKTFTNYVLSIRIDRAKELLLSEKISSTDIAFKVGFENLSYFYRKFKEFTGFCPGEFLKIVKSRPDASRHQ
jgi:AraC-like DNA-binding protein